MELTYIIVIFIGVVLVIVAFFVLKKFVFSVKSEAIIKLFNKKQYDEAIKLLKTLSQRNDRNPMAHFYLGEAYYQMENYEWSLPHFRKVTQINKYSADVEEVKTRERLAEIYLHFQKLEEAQKELLLIINLNPDNYFYYYRVGEIFFQRHYTDNAAVYFKKALERKPTHVDSLFRLGEINYEAKRYTEALNDMKACLKSDPSYKKANYYVGMVYLSNKNYSQAISEFEKSSTDPEYRLRSFYQKGKALVDSGSSDRGILELERGIHYITEEDSTSLAIRYLYASTQEQARNITAALEQWDIISKINPNYQNLQKKLEEYKELRMDDSLKDLMTASDNRFGALCDKIVKNLGLEILDISIKQGVVANILASEAESEWRGVRKAKQFIKIMRTSEKTGDSIVRELLDTMKNAGAVKSICISTSEFSRQAIDYAETRPVQLYDQSQLSNLLKDNKKEVKSKKKS